MADGVPTKKILVTLNTLELEVPEDFTDEQIADLLDSGDTTARVWQDWKYEEDWRN